MEPDLDALRQKATTAIQTAMEMTEEMEDRMQCQLDDACKMVDRLLEENQNLKKQIEVDKALHNVSDGMTNFLEEENEELTSALKDAYEKMDFLREEANRARRDFTGLQLAVSVLIFVYGVIYGKYSCM